MGIVQNPIKTTQNPPISTIFGDWMWYEKLTFTQQNAVKKIHQFLINQTYKRPVQIDENYFLSHGDYDWLSNLIIAAKHFLPPRIEFDLDWSETENGDKSDSFLISYEIGTEETCSLMILPTV